MQYLACLPLAVMLIFNLYHFYRRRNDVPLQTGAVRPSIAAFEGRNCPSLVDEPR